MFSCPELFQFAYNSFVLTLVLSASIDGIKIFIIK